MNLERWNKFSLWQKMGNIGSEIARARLCDEKLDQPGRAAALGRVLEMIDATLSTLPSKAAQSEMQTARGLIVKWQKNAHDFSPLTLENYFTQFVLLNI